MESFEQTLKDMYALGVKHGKEMQKKEAELEALQADVEVLEKELSNYA